MRSGLALKLSLGGRLRESINDAYFGPEYTEHEMEKALRDAGLNYNRPKHLAGEIASKINPGKVVARFGSKMEYGPRALGNRSILFHAKDPEVNQWLNQRLGRTEFMSFAPVTPWEDRHDHYDKFSGAEHAAQFMTITFDCTDKMKEQCPAAVHIDGTARPQLIRREVNPVYYDILREHENLSGISTLINTSYNLHEEPIVCAPDDAVRAFIDDQLDVLTLGPYIVESQGEQVPESGGNSYSTSITRETTEQVSEPNELERRVFGDGLDVSLKKITDVLSVKDIWLDLQQRSSYSFFQPWTWTSSWLSSSPAESDTYLFEFRRSGRVVGIGVLGLHALCRRKIFSSNGQLVSESGVPSCDALTVEHSGLLIERGFEVPVLKHCFRFLDESIGYWDEFYVSGLEESRVTWYTEAVSSLPNLCSKVIEEHPYFYVDLRAIGVSGNTILETLSANTRYPINPAKPLYEREGPVKIHLPQSLDEATAMFLRMK